VCSLNTLESGASSPGQFSTGSPSTQGLAGWIPAFEWEQPSWHATGSKVTGKLPPAIVKGRKQTPANSKAEHLILILIDIVCLGFPVTIMLARTKVGISSGAAPAGAHRTKWAIQSRSGAVQWLQRSCCGCQCCRRASRYELDLTPLSLCSPPGSAPRQTRPCNCEGGRLQVRE